MAAGSGFPGGDKPDPGRRRALFSGLTGRDGDVSGKAQADRTVEMLTAAYGTTERGAINTKAAAKDLGVTQRTVQRWIARDEAKRSAPRSARLKALSAKARQAATTQQGRKRAMKDVRNSKRGQRMAKSGARVVVGGRQGPRSSSANSIRSRTVELNIDAADVNALWTEYERGGESAASKWLTDYADDKYLENWHFESIEDFDMKTR